MNREQLKQQIVKNFEDAEITEKERLENVMQCIDAHNEQLRIGGVMPRFSDEEIEEDYDLQDCPNCGSDAVGYDGTGSVPFLECFQCDHNWIP